MTTKNQTEWAVRLQENQLLWRPTAGSELWRTQPLYFRQPLGDFDSMGRHFTPNNALSFAQKWGPLGLCVHNRPLHHGATYGWGLESDATLRPEAPEGERLLFSNVLDAWVELPRSCSPRRVVLSDGAWFVESLAAWQDLSYSVNAIVDVLTALKRKKPLPESEIQSLSQIGYGLGPAGEHFRCLAGDEAKQESSRSAAWELISTRLNELLLGAPIRFFWEFDPNDGEPRIDFVVDNRFGTFPVIAGQLLSMVSDPARGVASTCSGCTLPFVQTYEHSRGKRVYCSMCRRGGAPNRDAARDYRKRQGEKRRKQ